MKQGFALSFCKKIAINFKLMPLNFPENCRQKWDIYDSFANKTLKN